MAIISPLELEKYQNWYFLRDGDFLPERVGDSKYRQDRMMLNIFLKNGSIFPTKEEAAAAGRIIRAFLSAYQKQASPHKEEGSSVHCNQHRPKPLVIIDEEGWTYYSDGVTISTWRYVKMFLFSKGHKDPFVKRCLEVARRCFRCSLKPSQLPLGSEKPIESK